MFPKDKALGNSLIIQVAKVYHYNNNCKENYRKLPYHIDTSQIIIFSSNPIFRLGNMSASLLSFLKSNRSAPPKDQYPYINKTRRLKLSTALLENKSGPQIVHYWNEEKIQQADDPNVNGFELVAREDSTELYYDPESIKRVSFRRTTQNRALSVKDDIVEPILKTNVPIENVVTFSLGFLDNLTPAQILHHRLFNSIIKRILTQSNNRPDSDQYKIIAHESFSVWYQDPDCIQFVSSDTEDRPMPQHWWSAGLTHKLKGNFLLPWKIHQMHFLDLFALDAITANSFVVILNREEPWRQLLGRALQETFVKPLAVLCAPNGKNVAPNDYASAALASVLSAENYDHYTVQEGVRAFQHPETRKRDVCLGPLSLYVRKPGVSGSPPEIPEGFFEFEPEDLIVDDFDMFNEALDSMGNS
ncbi:hypothetical protein N0V90_004319 [Kalmusia sp. IMI 367209]|nr:hypothetical protein N0V90_004319 [Kalmusia sp. IMI 367209]